MDLIAWPFKFVYEVIVDLLLSIVGHHREKESFDRREKVYKPIRDLLTSSLGVKFKTKTYRDQLSKSKRSLGYKTVSLILLILGILWLRYSVIEPYKIPSGSMIPTLKIGDHIFVNKLAYGLRIPFIGEITRWGDPKRGDIVIFRPPLDNDKVYVKRLIGVPGDKIRIDDDKLYVNDELMAKSTEPFFPTMEDVSDSEQYTPDNYTLYKEDLKGIKHDVVQVKDRNLLYRSFNMEIVVPEGALFFMGDNRDNSEDSRVWGFASRDEVRGKAMFIWLSLSWPKILTPSWIRFSRIGMAVK